MSDGGEGKTPRLDLNVIKERMKTIREALPVTGFSEPVSGGIEDEPQASPNGDLSLKLQDGQTSQQTPKPPSESADEGGGQYCSYRVPGYCTVLYRVPGTVQYSSVPYCAGV